jgi:hypothetical protein
MKLYSFGVFMMGFGFGLLSHNRIINILTRKRINYQYQYQYIKRK